MPAGAAPPQLTGERYPVLRMPVIFIDPDGTLGASSGSAAFGAFVIVRSATGVTYAHQCGGIASELRSAEGFLVPVGGARIAEPLIAFFAREGCGPPNNARWSDGPVAELRALVAEIPAWRTSPHDQGERLRLSLDESALEEITEAWVPVISPYGRGVLIFSNCD